MNRILILLAGLLVVGESFALPPCPSSGVFHNCFGTYTSPTGHKYVGEWKDDKRHGQGTLTSPNGDKYVGEWKDGKRHGQGTMTNARGEKYVGEFKDGKKDGQGTYTNADGAKYVGELKDGKKHGQGTYTWANGDKYVGEYKDDKRHGQGTYTWADGRKYVGEYKNGKPREGIMYLASGEIAETYSNGKWCEGCEPTARLLAIVGEINSGPIATTPIQAPQETTVQTGSAEIVVWQSIKDSNDPDMFQAYLKKFPEGAFLDLAKIRLKNLGGDTPVAPSIPNLDYGNYHALVIGNNNYRHLSDLETAINDANAIGRVLENDYGFAVKVLTNATRTDILDTFSQYRRKVSAKDNLLIYFAGHGHLDRDMDEGYWLPIDAVEDSFTNWISNSSIISSVRGMQAKHVMVVADSCFSGTLVRAVKITPRTPDSLQKFVNLKARTALTSGGIEPVTDVGGGQHSVFARALLSLLEQNPGVMNGQELFVALRRKVQLNADQIPEYGDIRKAGHDGGDFLFVRR